MSKAAEIISALALEPHPEGGWYRETWRGPEGPGGRATGTAIHFLLEADQRSHWHKVDASEVWLWHEGDPLELAFASDAHGPVATRVLGADRQGGQGLQHVIAPDEWQAARPLAGEHGYVLVSCIVTPGFDFAGFELAPPGWAPGG